MATKEIVNEEDAVCGACGWGSNLVLKESRVLCGVCGSSFLWDKNTKSYFEPVFESKIKYYQRSPYTPLLPDRRVNNRPYPKARDRRAPQ